MSTRSHLEAALIDAEDGLAGLVAGGAQEEKLEPARVRCRDARLALRKLNLQEGKPRDFRESRDAVPSPLDNPLPKRASRGVRVVLSGGARVEAGRLKWQIVQALSLLVAFFQYYYLDVYQQISTLPTAQVTFGQNLFS